MQGIQYTLSHVQEEVLCPHLRDEHPVDHGVLLPDGVVGHRRRQDCRHLGRRNGPDLPGRRHLRPRPHHLRAGGQAGARRHGCFLLYRSDFSTLH
jgi:hypothetical protein